ncbi:spore germination protein [Paenibacillus alkaliterrae]|uniref:spore germination protein n=1 Tax=Paenibacillus alkaliterrae TaxID=320909 RepID=UPI001F2CAD2B|nr:spore germination protein [Paenibacillus alkaliterrae]MCF2939405.1 spore germination protein [Paenibacillus alkaliterrae]
MENSSGNKSQARSESTSGTLQGNKQQAAGQPGQPISEQPISERLTDNLHYLESIFAKSSDIIFKHWNYGPELKFTALSVYYGSLVQEDTVNYMKLSLQDLVTHHIGPGMDVTPQDIRTFFEQDGVSEKKAIILNNLHHVVEEISNGQLLIMFDQWNKALCYRAQSVETRQVNEPVNESVVQGPRESTVENLQKNIGLLRLRLKTPKFKIEMVTAGGETKSTVAYGYIEDIVDGELLAEFKKRIEQIKQLEILETSYIEQLIEDSTYSPFPQHRYTERTDMVVASMLDGKIAVLVQGTGGVLLCPGLFTEFFQSSEDYYQRTMIASLVRLLRIMAFIIALTLPSIYIALSTFHPELIPTVLLLAILNAREGIPLPAFFEALLMEFFFELMREAGIRLPRPVGSAVSIVGALVIGDAAISAGIASPIMVIVVALTGIASFSIPQYSVAISLRILRFPLMLSAALMGGFGMMICLLFLLLHLCKLRTLGQPYMAPLAPLRLSELRDVFVRVPLKTLLRKPRDLHKHKPLK